MTQGRPSVNTHVRMIKKYVLWLMWPVMQLLCTRIYSDGRVQYIAVGASNENIISTVLVPEVPANPGSRLASRGVHEIVLVRMENVDEGTMDVGLFGKDPQGIVVMQPGVV